MYFLNSKLLVSISVIALATTLLADKPSWAGKGKPPTAKERDAHKESMKLKGKNKKNSFKEKGEKFKNKKNRDMEDEVENDKDDDVETLHQIPNPFAN